MSSNVNDSSGSMPQSKDSDISRVVSHVEKPVQGGLGDDFACLDEVSKEQHAKTFRKVDWHLMPMLMALYLIANLDRANLGNAKIEGLETDLGMTGTDYNICNMMFFIPYILCEVPANSILVRFSRPSIWLSIIVTAWGIVMTCSGFCQNFAGLVVCRVLLGVFEAGFFPGAVYLISQWYPPHMTQFRMSMLYSAAAMSGAFSGLLAAGFAQMAGLANYNGWRWIFIIEGIMTVLLGLATVWILPDSPEHSKGWLADGEIRYVKLLHRKYRGNHVQQEDPLNEVVPAKRARKWKILASVVTDWQIYLQGLIFMSSSVPTYALKFTLPQIMVNMGFKSTQAQLLSAPPYVAGALSAICVSTLADRSRWRVPFIIGPQLGLMSAYAVLFSFSAEISTHVALCYTFVHVATISVYPIIPGGNTWTLSNLAGSTKRAMGVAFMIALGNCGGIIGSFIFLADESPRYQTGWGTSLSFVCLGIASATTLEVGYTLINKKRDKVSREEIEATFSADALEDMGDRSPLFRYAL
ncbi:related to permease of the major facilitator superfamily [Cephalotrichum gorgonifer]|uniref:Related to permease of the major facilitator superfamily n=1 Tax=Cephalotrichum gorgonifer TaxID=2041049 RepID=A0AAE8N5S9_9PEZI|nr:related to permease of the major facilitator superfamily [Cephalotrichum gorgonifer]